MSSPRPIVLFDGECTLCNRSLDFILRHEKGPLLAFASLQSEAGKELLRGRDGSFDSMVLLEDGNVYTHSEAALRIATYLRAPFNVGRFLLHFPSALRNAAYRVVARNRYQWFGREASCRVPTPELRARFLTTGEEAATALRKSHD